MHNLIPSEMVNRHALARGHGGSWSCRAAAGRWSDQFGCFFRYWIVSEGAPGVAAEEAAEGKPNAFECAVDLDGLDTVVAACGIVAAAAVATAH